MRGILHVTGIVQGVGFRPFVYRLAKQFQLKGYVLNMGNSGVKIELEGEKQEILTFGRELERNLPRIFLRGVFDIFFAINLFLHFY